MLFRQLFDAESCTYTYLIASRSGGEALIVDSVLEHVEQYIRILDQLDLKLVKVVDTHTHADHITAMGALRDRAVSQRTHSRDMIRVGMGIYDLHELEVQLIQNSDVLLHVFQDRINDQCLAAGTARNQIGISTRFGIKELSEQHRVSLLV